MWFILSILFTAHAAPRAEVFLMPVFAGVVNSIRKVAFPCLTRERQSHTLLGGLPSVTAWAMTNANYTCRQKACLVGGPSLAWLMACGTHMRRTLAEGPCVKSQTSQQMMLCCKLSSIENLHSTGEYCAASQSPRLFHPLGINQVWAC